MIFSFQTLNNFFQFCVKIGPVFRKLENRKTGKFRFLEFRNITLETSPLPLPWAMQSTHLPQFITQPMFYSLIVNGLLYRKNGCNLLRDILSVDCRAYILIMTEISGKLLFGYESKARGAALIGLDW